ncbi:uncharacterized protein CLUP02_16635 [Colletotrichum lupini]|uniref:Uncharacterized protein n=1 Tax=Colletotrichum lupini TaxID=145971 RepID=A0A9Q8WPV2_9PEZI|nr:uncharacterized protein CLUP02_16635 [Colletotrichum lupini]UQC91101.1 hypothetical protein CLUP02_16635 [Colletotrichum lupini]
MAWTKHAAVFAALALGANAQAPTNTPIPANVGFVLSVQPPAAVSNTTSLPTSAITGISSTPTASLSVTLSSSSSSILSQPTTAIPSSGSSSVLSSGSPSGGSTPGASSSFTTFASGTGDANVDGKWAALSPAFGSGYRLRFDTTRQLAQQFRLRPDCALTTADGTFVAMVGGTANLHFQYFFQSTAIASSLVNVNFEADVCQRNADNTLTCTAMGQSIFQVTPGDPSLQLGDENYGEVVTINMITVPGTIFR